MDLLETSPLSKQSLVLNGEKEYWVYPINAKRGAFGEFHHLILDLKEDESRFKSYFRMGRNALQKDTEMWEDNQERRLEQAGGAINYHGRPSQYGMWIREKLVTYFNRSGALPWQDNYS
ncbi:hypothetical protein PoB_001763100 [Plakobranchus ocellatus]|uniref:Aromatic-ring-hydroxylating dioxygenase alpha subunit C-terminal domain-containing protein n=1 Tax=Plakobranchus ocellatus TaxID=259542 RepID=A0AAV3Z5I2_9GAST|nr:hypothetical protein PoB_001763100 [Plakobranchus ocellatus]